MVYDLAEVEDRGNYYFVLNVTKSSLDLINSNNTYLKLSDVSYKKIYDLILEGKQVRINKKLLTNEVMPGEISIIENDDELKYAKNASFIKIKMLVTPELTKESGFTLYNFIMRNNELASKGFYIYDGNREEKYIEIIETGDEELIFSLEQFLESKDKLERASSFLQKLDDYKSEIKYCKTIQEILEKENNFISLFYSYF